MTAPSHLQRAARILQRSTGSTTTKYMAALREATEREAADPGWARRTIDAHAAARDSARARGDDPGRFGSTPPGPIA